MKEASLPVDYSDITTSIAIAPLWWDHGVPRYVPFHPKWAESHAREVVYVRSSCQHCGLEYRSVVLGYTEEFERASSIASRGFLPGWDPPLTLTHCDIGKFMSSVPIEALEYWRKAGPRLTWTRMSEFEVTLGGT